ncbi:DUF3099 domain-containing protein [Streptomyces sp. KMM 9044]|uniref:DUF3099 domain-containing protein n=1 Tax=Streptomyces sp. KMM 9044 TaxID=2744474 RepID=UPI00215160B2|nr:DUF3099 domain-containing protein [Streptomyces sp. KMM 9044]WAX82237.1 DUF3099 domain-containing protein [Streptomyces sp. KMM 9044]
MSRTPWRRRDEPRVESITAAHTGLTQDLRSRQRRYLVAMLVRSGCVVLMALTWSRWPALSVCALAGAVLIPYVAVVVAQAGWRQQRGVRHMPAGASEKPAPRVVLEPTLILPSERDTAD